MKNLLSSINGSSLSSYVVASGIFPRVWKTNVELTIVTTEHGTLVTTAYYIILFICYLYIHNNNPITFCKWGKTFN